MYPSGDLLPENLLRFYLHLSAPMRRGEAYDHVKLVGPDGKEVEGAFLNIAQEFWDPSMKRLTLMLDPGRIKRGAAPNLEAGVPLQADETFRLVVDPAWRDAAGNPLAQPYEKRFRVGAADRESPDPRSWLIRPPAAGTTAPLVVDFPEPLDHALLGSLLGVRTSEGERVDGEVEVLAGETRWRFTPARVWASTSYVLVASPTLEDVAGNNLDIPFDLDLHRVPRSSPTHGVVFLPFKATSSRDLEPALELEL